VDLHEAERYLNRKALRFDGEVFDLGIKAGLSPEAANHGDGAVV